MSNYDYPPYPPRQPQRVSLWPVILLLLLAGALLWRFWPRHPESGIDPNATPRPVVARGNLSELEQATIALYKEAAPSVVHVTRFESVDTGLDVEQIPAGTGSGFVWDQEGHIVTNNHVVADAEAFKVVLADHYEARARVVGKAAASDLAVLKIDAPKSRLHPILVGSSHDLQVGQSAFAIGNPFGLDQTLTTGVISALDREIRAPEEPAAIKGAIQTDAAINPGNSGGPLLDSAGRLIGVNTAILSRSGAYAGISFAIPVDEVNRVVPEIIRHGTAAKAGIGVKVASDQINQRLDLEGVLIISVLPGSPAEKAGLQPTRGTQLGDIIIGVDGQRVHSSRDLTQIFDRHKVGDTVTLTIQRGDQQLDVPVTLEAVRS